MRFLTAFLTFAIGITAAATIIPRSFDYASDAVPEIEYPSTDLKAANLTEESPEFVPFFESTLNEYFDGWFTADEFEGMREVWTVQLGRNDGNRDSWYALVRTVPLGGDSADQVNFESISFEVHRDRFSFLTERINGVHYQFVGRFPYGGSLFSDGEKVLNGTLTKFENGKPVARFSSFFEYSEPRCTQ